MNIFEELESEVRGYCRSWPTVFSSSKGWTMTDETGRDYIDFFAGAGALSYGHNNPAFIEPLIDYLRSDGVLHGLDMMTVAKRDFIESFSKRILEPRGLSYKIQFPGPTGTNAVEAALKIARKATGRQRIISFTNAFHGMSLGSLAITGNLKKRAGAGVPLTLSDSMPFENFGSHDGDSLGYLESFLEDDGSGVETPAAIILETLQAEGGINVASDSWLQRLAAICRRYEIVLIVDDIQVGCGRTGKFFSWENSGITPDIVCLSKSLSGSGLPFAVTLMRPELDVWEPGEHNGTFRGNNAAFITATAALETYWSNDELTLEVERKEKIMHDGLVEIASTHDGLFDDVRGRGLIQGIPAAVPEVAQMVTGEAFQRGLLVETAGANDDVVKLLPPLVVDDAAINNAIEILAESVDAVIERGGEELIASQKVPA